MFKHTFLLAGAAALVLTCFSSWAAVRNQTLIDSNRRYEFSAATAAFAYTQNGSVTSRDKEIGVLPGLKFAVSTIDGGQYFSFDVRYFLGSNKFTGYYTTAGVSTPFNFSSARDLLFVKGRIGQPFNFFSQQMLTPYMQVGFYMWDRKLSAPPTTRGAKATENYNHFDLSLGLKYDLALTEHWTLDAFGSVGRTLGPTMSVHVDGEESSIPNFSLGSNLIMEYGLNTYYHLSRDLDLALGGNIQTFKYGNSSKVVTDSAATYDLSGKSSTTVIWQANLGFSWRFAL